MPEIIDFDDLKNYSIVETRIIDELKAANDALFAQLQAEEKRNLELVTKLNAVAPRLARLDYLERELAKEADA